MLLFPLIRIGTVFGRVAMISYPIPTCIPLKKSRNLCIVVKELLLDIYSNALAALPGKRPSKELLRVFIHPGFRIRLSKTRGLN